MAQALGRSPSFVNPHVIELLAPLYPTIPCDDAAVYSVTLRRTADDWLEITFPELSRPGKIVAVDVECVNGEGGACRCDYGRLLRSVLVLMEKQIFRVTLKYVVTSIENTNQPTGDAARKIATLQVFVTMHERLSNVKTEALREFDLLLSHLQAGLSAVSGRRDVNHLSNLVERAMKSKCHVVGCDLHSAEAEPHRNTRYKLDDVFQRLTAVVPVEQMAVRDDETYIPRMKKSRREIILTDLPVPALHNFVKMLDARDLAAVSGVCTMFQNLSYEVVPGLNLLLYAHQRKGLKWMLYREGPTRRELTMMTHPYVFPGIRPPTNANPQDEDSQLKAIDLIDGQIVNLSSVSPAADCRGGLFCDEPGLGKTITMLALILRTKGQRSDPQSVEPPPTVSERSGISLRSSATRGRTLNPQALEPSRTTLIVVPNPLLDHWKFQIRAHLARRALNVYIDDLEFKTALPTAKTLATYDVVITSFGRLHNEWKFGRPASALEERTPDRYGYEGGPQRFIDGTINRGISPLLMVHWVRLIVDEGHKLGGTNQSNHMKMARLFQVDKRWVMTGTPTPNTMQSADLRHMHGLLVFLRDRPYGDVDGKAWLKAIAKPFEQNDRAGYIRLLHLLSRIMMRHTKESIKALIPTPIRHEVIIDPTQREYAMYNGVAAVARANLHLTNIDPKYPGATHYDSLLHVSNRQHAMSVLKNLREATCSGGQIRATLTPENFAETINMLNGWNVPPERVAAVTEYLRKAESIDFLTLCTLCGRHMQLLMLMPCGHMACVDCVEDRYNKVGPSCGICNAQYDVEVFQMLQPGFDFQKIDEEFVYDHGPQPPPQVATDNGTMRRRMSRAEGSTVPVSEAGIGSRRRIVPIDLARFGAINASKAFYVASRITELKKEYQAARIKYLSQDGSSTTRMQPPRTVKAIIFSQFKDHIWRTKVALAQQGIQCADFFTFFSPAYRMQCLHKFRMDPTSNVLMLSEIGSHGLDLSFVTHIFLMEEIWDKSLESQVISRAHRMGAQQSVVVEQLLMRGSVEWNMHEMSKRQAAGIEDSAEPDRERDDHYDHPTPRHAHRSDSRAANSLLGGHKKGKSHRVKIGSLPTESTSEVAAKSTIRHRQMQRVLQSLRLMDEGAVSEFGFVNFKVLDENNKPVRSASLALPNPGQRPGTTTTETTPSIPTSVSTTTTTSALPPRVQYGNDIVATNTLLNRQVNRTAPSVAAAQDQPQPARAQLLLTQQPKKAKKSVRIKVEASPPPKPARPPQAASAIIDLTSDGDSDVAQPKPAVRRQSTESYFLAYKGSSEEEDDSETDDEWTPIKREVKIKSESSTKRKVVKIKSEPSMSKSPHATSNGKGKARRKRPVIDDDDDSDYE